MELPCFPLLSGCRHICMCAPNVHKINDILIICSDLSSEFSHGVWCSNNSSYIFLLCIKTFVSNLVSRSLWTCRNCRIKKITLSIKVTIHLNRHKIGTSRVPPSRGWISCKTRPLQCLPHAQNYRCSPGECGCSPHCFQFEITSQGMQLLQELLVRSCDFFIWD